MGLWAPTGSRVIDTITRGVLAACLINIVVSMYMLNVYPSPISTSLRIVQYLMEEDATACKQQNTKHNREIKQADNGKD